MIAPKADGELRVMKVSAGHAYVWQGDEWLCTATLELAAKIVEWLRAEKAQSD